MSRKEITMPCEPEELKHVPLFELLDDEELAVLAAQTDLSDSLLASASSKLATHPGRPTSCCPAVCASPPSTKTSRRSHRRAWARRLLPFASMLDGPLISRMQWLCRTLCVELDRNDITVLLQRKPGRSRYAPVLGRQFHASQGLSNSVPAQRQ
jgi:hypothetical protein